VTGKDLYQNEEGKVKFGGVKGGDYSGKPTNEKQKERVL